MLFIYNIGIHLYYLMAGLFSLYKNKAKLWIDGRKHQQVQPLESSIWFHFASLGEFEQGRPVLEAIKEQYPLQKIVITFFSPSGYELRKNTPLANAVYYLPLDTAANAQKFISRIKPQMAIFTKYEYWYHFFNELHKQHIPLYIISGIFRPGQVFFKWYGGLHRKMLKMITWLFLQDAESKQLLHDIGITNLSISGDTRFDRVWANAGNPKSLPEIAQFKNGKKLFIAGSTWPQDEALIAEIIKQHPDWKFVIAPHEVSEEKIKSLTNLLPTETTIKFSDISILNPDNYQDQISNLIIDNIGILSSLYQYADIAYIGGGFGAGIHNTLEAAAFCMPVIFGPKYQKFKEARDLVELGAGFSIGSQEEFNQITNRLMDDEQNRHTASVIAKDYVRQNIGATDTIVNYITAQH